MNPKSRLVTSLADALQDIARRPLECIARLGSDEFAALWLDCPAQKWKAGWPI